MGLTSIEWTDISLNPIRARCKDGKQRVAGHFCQKISAGCANCYSSNFQPRFKMPTFPGTNKTPEDVGVEVFLDDDVLKSLLSRRKPAKVFWCDMSDLFGEWVPFEWIDKCFAVMALTPHLTHQILTKRPERMAKYTYEYATPRRWWQAAPPEITGAKSVYDYGWNNTLPNVWLGCSCENQEAADKRIPHLLKCPAAVRFLSCEPLLGPIDLKPAFIRNFHDEISAGYPGLELPEHLQCHLGRLGWVIVGGESGARARPMHPDWARSVRDQCVAAGVPFFFKQWGAWYPIDGISEFMDYVEKKPIWFTADGAIDEKVYKGELPALGDGEWMVRIGKGNAGRVLDGKEWDEMPEIAAGVT